MSKNILDKLFGSGTRVKILKFTFRNPSVDFTIAELARIVQEPLEKVKREVSFLNQINLLKPKK